MVGHKAWKMASLPLDIYGFKRKRSRMYIFMFCWPCISNIIVWRKTNSMHNLFLVYFFNFYMFRAYLDQLWGGTTVYKQQLVLILFRWLSVVLVGYNPNKKSENHLKRIISTNCCIHTVVPPDEGPRYARNMKRLTKYTKNKLCIKLVFLHAITDVICWDL